MTTVAASPSSSTPGNASAASPQSQPQTLPVATSANNSASGSASATAAAAASQPYASASLYVGDLNADVTEALLFEIFNAVGPVASVRVCRDAATRRSLGYAYVNFHRLEDAERALDTLNFKMIRGRACRIMWSHRDPSLRRSGVGNIFVNHLSKDIDNKQLYDTFSVFGNILSCKVATNSKRESLGYGFVHYESDEAANMAIARVDGKIINQQQVSVQKFMPKKDRPSAQQKNRYTNVFVKNLPLDITVQQLEDLFKAYGNITSSTVNIPTDRSDDKARAFGFLNFETSEQAAAAVDAGNNMELVGKKLYAARAQKKEERQKELVERFENLKLERAKKYAGVNLYVKNLSEDIDDAKLTAEFTKYGPITSATVMKDSQTTKSRGFGFVCFTTPDDATRAVTEMNGKMLEGKPLYVALAQRKEQRRAQLEAQYAARQKLGAAAAAAGGVGVGMSAHQSGGMPLNPGVVGVGANMQYNPAVNVNAAQLANMPFMFPQQQLLQQQRLAAAANFNYNPQQLMAAAANQQNMRWTPQQNMMSMMGAAAGQPQMRNPQQLNYQLMPANAAAAAAAMNMNAARAAAAAGMQGVPVNAVANQRAAGGPSAAAGPANPTGTPRSAAAAANAAGRPNMQQAPNVNGVPLTNPAVAAQAAAIAAAAAAGRPIPPQQAAAMLGKALPQQQQIRYNDNVRNQQQVGAAVNQQGQRGVVPGGPAQAQPQGLSQDPLTPSALASAPEELRKQMIGERLFPLVQHSEPERAGKITGMLLEMDNGELLHLLESREALNEKIMEALTVLQQHGPDDEQLEQ